MINAHPSRGSATPNAGVHAASGEHRVPHPAPATSSSGTSRIMPGSLAGLDKGSVSSSRSRTGPLAPRADLARFSGLQAGKAHVLPLEDSSTGEANCQDSKPPADPYAWPSLRALLAADAQAQTPSGDLPDHASKVPPNRAPLEAATTCAAASTMRHSLSSYGAPAVDVVAAGFSLAAFNLTCNPPAAKVTGALSGILWFAGAAVHEVGNLPYSVAVSGANLLGAAAGALSAAAPFIFGETQSRMAYASAGTWAANGAATILRAAISGPSAAGRILQGASGAANFGAAGLAAASVRASIDNDSVKAARLGTASSVLWGVAAVAEAGSAWIGRPGRQEVRCAPDHGDSLT